jgi:hypothetical protein
MVAGWRDEVAAFAANVDRRIVDIRGILERP